MFFTIPLEQPGNLPVYHRLVADQPQPDRIAPSELDGLAKKLAGSLHGEIEVGQMPGVLQQIVSTLCQAHPSAQFTELLSAVLVVFDQVIDATDTEWLPDALTDPLFKALARPFCAVIIFDQHHFQPVPEFVLSSPSEDDAREWLAAMRQEFSDGLDWNDLAMATSSALYFCRHFDELSAPQRADLAKTMIFALVDSVPIPFLPQSFSHFLFRQFVGPLVELLLKQ